MLLHIDAVAGETVHTSSMQHWLHSLSWQAEFAQRTPGAGRIDGERDWKWYGRAISYRKHAFRKRVRHILAVLGKRPTVPMTVDWLRSHGDKLWETRSMLADDLSRLIFDLSLVLPASSHRQCYFPRIDFENLAVVEGTEPFDAEGLPGDYDGRLGRARDTIRSFKPRLAISGYHKPDDLWEIPRKIRELNPGYELTFGHHSPVQWESVFYAVQRD